MELIIEVGAEHKKMLGKKWFIMELSRKKE